MLVQNWNDIKKLFKSLMLLYGIDVQTSVDCENTIPAVKYS